MKIDFNNTPTTNAKWQFEELFGSNDYAIESSTDMKDEPHAIRALFTNCQTDGFFLTIPLNDILDGVYPKGVDIDLMKDAYDGAKSVYKALQKLEQDAKQAPTPGDTITSGPG